MLHDDCEETTASNDSAPWMATFADLSTLLLTFFILLLSFANMDIVKFRDMLGSVKEAFGYQTVAYGNHAPELLATNPEAKHQQQTQQDPKLKEEISRIIEENELKESVEILASNRGVIVRVKDQLMFAPGSARLSPASFGLLDGIVQLVDRFPGKLLIEGHTDNAPIRTRRFPSNWELSTARAIAVLRYLAEVGGIDTSRLGSAGYADTRPLAPNNGPANRAQNRRVEFVYYREDLDPPARSPAPE